MKKRVLSLLLALVMVLSVFPMTAFAAQDVGPAPAAPAQNVAEQPVSARDIPEPVAEKELLEILAMFSAEDAPGCEDEEEPAQKAAPKKAMLKGTAPETVAGEFTLTYDANGGEGTAPDAVASISSTAVAEPSGLYKTGWRFKEWNTKADGSGDAYAPGANIELAEDTTLFAQWKEIVYVARVTDAKGYYVNAKDAGGNSIDTQGQFETLQAAINAIPADKAEYKITMLQDFEYEGINIATVKKDQVVVLDLVGHDVTLLVNKDAASSVIKVEAGGNLTMMDSADTDADGEDCGTISGKLMEGIHPGTWASGGASDPNTYNYSTTLFANSGTFTMNSGKLHNTVKDGNIVYAVDCGSNSTLNVNGGWLLSDGSNAVRLFGNNINFNMTGGKLDANAKAQAVWIQTSDKTAYKVNVNISGGTLVGGAGGAYALSDAADNASGIHYNISGGYFGGAGGFFTYGGNVRITGGTFEGTVALRQDYPNTTISITGGTFNGKVSSYGEYAKIKYVTGGTFKDFPNYNSARSIYIHPETGIAYKKYNVYWQISEEDGYEYNCYNDYINAGFTLYPKAWIYGIDEEWNEVRMHQYYVYKDGKYVETIYLHNDDGYGISKEDAAAYRFETYDLLEKVYFYYGYNYLNKATLDTHPHWTGDAHPTDTSKAWGAVMSDDPEECLALSYSSKYYYGDPYYPTAWASWADNNCSHCTEEWFNFTNYWQKNYACDYQGMYTYEDDGLTYKMYNVARASDVKLIADGYIDKTNEDGTFDVVPKEIDMGEAEVKENDQGETVIEVKGTAIEVDRTNGDKEEVEAEVAAAIISNTLVNKEVTSFLDTNINNATTVEAIKAALKEQAGDDEEAKQKIEDASWEDGDIKTRVNVDLTKATVSDTIAASTTTCVNVATFDVKPVAKTTIITGTTEGTSEVTYEAVIPNDDISDEITFRLPVNQTVVSPSANIYHNHDGSSEENDGKGELIGTYPIQTSKNGEKFIELSASVFSFYTYEILDIADNSVVAIKDEANNNRGFASLAEAVASYLSDGNEDDLQIILLNNCASIDYEGKEVVINLNGYKLMGTSENATNVTIVNENEKKLQTLEAIGIYANDVSALAADGYDTKTSDPQIGSVENNQVYKTTGTGVYQVIVTAEAGNDRVADNDAIDLFAGDYVSVQVKVKGARFVAADVTLNFDPNLFEIEESPATMWDEEEGSFHFYNAKSGKGYYDDGYVLGTFLFKAKAQTSNVTGFFTVGSDTVKTYVSGAWSEGWNSGAANALSTGDITNASANIILKNMTASVTPINGQSYKATELKLLQPGYSAVDSTTGKAITDATITYAYLTKAEVDGTLKEGKTDEYEEGKGPKVPDDDDYTSTIPAPVNAGDYVVFYKVAKDGYVTVADKINVSIAKAETTITWKATGFNKVNEGVTTDHAGNNVEEDYYKEYADTAAALPVAEYDCLETNQKGNATVTITTPDDATELKSVGSYTVTASLSDNYKILNPTCTLLIDGGLIEGYDLQNTTEGAKVWYDDQDHIVAQLVKDTTLKPTDDKTTIKYSLNGGEWQDTIPEVKEVGTYELKMKITADSYYDFTDTVNFEIKNVEYKVEKTDYVTGWDLVLVYTNDAVPGFTYTVDVDTPVVKNMYNVSDLGYEHGTVWNAAGTAVVTTGTRYTYVYAIVVFGDADITKVTPSNTASITIDRTNTKDRYDVNNSNSVDINDLVAVQGTYNVGSDYLNDEQMSIVLRADVSGNKKVDTYDCSLVKLYSGSIS